MCGSWRWNLVGRFDSVFEAFTWKILGSLKDARVVSIGIFNAVLSLDKKHLFT